MEENAHHSPEVTRINIGQLFRRASELMAGRLAPAVEELKGVVEAYVASGGFMRDQIHW